MATHLGQLQRFPPPDLESADAVEGTRCALCVRLCCWRNFLAECQGCLERLGGGRRGAERGCGPCRWLLILTRVEVSQQIFIYGFWLTGAGWRAGREEIWECQSSLSFEGKGPGLEGPWGNDKSVKYSKEERKHNNIINENIYRIE